MLNRFIFLFLLQQHIRIVGIITKLRLWRGIALLHKRSEQSQRKCSIISFPKVDTIVLLFEMKEPDIPETIMHFTQTLKDANKRVYHVIYYSGNLKLLTLESNDQRFIFTRKQLNLFYVPPSELVFKLAAINAEYYMDINLEESFPLIYLTVVSNAHLRIGKQSKIRLYHYDLLINHQTDNQQVFLDNLMHYLRILKPPLNE